jgi:nitrate reductase molybdenum cofactor assembly chaperone NarJ/NarW
MQHTCTLFAELLDYPDGDLCRQARACAALVAGSCPEAAALLGEFATIAQDTPMSCLEEIYTRTFDLKCLCYPYVGYHLVGESYRRGTFLARLNEGYRARGFSAGRELPDHISVVLRFLALDPEIQSAKPGDDAFAAVLLHEGLAPALAKMVACFQEESSNPYALVIRALWVLLDGNQPAAG